MSGRKHHGTPRPAPGRALLLLAAGTVLTTIFGVAACQAEPADDFGAPAVTTPVSAVPASDVPASVAPADPSVLVQDGAPPAAAADAPTRLTVPALKLDATVDAVGIDKRTGDFAVPPSVDRVGWYRFGPGFSAATGSIVVAGHVDSAAEGEGAFFRLGALKADDVVTLIGPGERTRAFRVVARERYRKTAIPLDKYFARDGAARLTLITCGGPFDPGTGHYRDNVVITAVPSP